MSSNQALKDLHALRHGDTCFMLGLTAEMEVDEVIKHVRNISTGVGIQAENVANCSEFEVLAISRCQFFFPKQMVDAVAPVGKKSLFAKATPLYGIDALQQKFGEFQRLAKEGVAVKTADLRIFRTYDWLLSEEQREIRERWFDASLQAVGLAPSKMILDSSVGDGSDVGSSSSSSKLKVSKDLALVKDVKDVSSSSSVAALKKKLKQAKDSKVDEDYKGLMKFFVAKSVS